MYEPNMTSLLTLTAIEDRSRPTRLVWNDVGSSFSTQCLVTVSIARFCLCAGTAQNYNQAMNYHVYSPNHRVIRA